MSEVRDAIARYLNVSAAELLGVECSAVPDPSDFDDAEQLLSIVAEAVASLGDDPEDHATSNAVCIDCGHAVDGWARAVAAVGCLLGAE